MTQGELLSDELDATDQLIELEPKHYNAWSHRLFLANRFGLLGGEATTEIEFASKFIDLDVRNNSAWNYRRYAMGRTTRAVAWDTEIEWVLDKIRLAPSNESPWVYLRSIPDWEQNDALLEFCEESMRKAHSDNRPILELRDIVDTLVSIYEKRELISDAIAILDKLIPVDSNRVNLLRRSRDKLIHLQNRI